MHSEPKLSIQDLNLNVGRAGLQDMTSAPRCEVSTY